MSEKELPRIGDRFRIPWRDYAECTITALPYEGNVIDFVYDNGEKSSLSKGDWMNWIGGRDQRIQER